MREVTPTLIAVFGVAHSGKSSVLRGAMDQLHERFNVEATAISDTEAGTGIFVMELERARVGFLPQGEPQTGFENQLQELVKRQCQIILCAARIREATATAVEQVAKTNGYRQFIWRSIQEVGPHWKGPDYRPSHAQVNGLCAEALADLVERIHGGLI